MSLQENKKSAVIDNKFSISMIETKDTYPLRMSILRPGLPAENSQYPGDNLNSTFHLGIQDLVTKNIVCNGTFILEQSPHFPDIKKAYRLRGMATDPDFRGLNLGRFLIEKAEDEIKNRSVSLLWFNARQSAFGFYHKLGYLAIGDLFDIPDVGPHQVMYKQL